MSNHPPRRWHSLVCYDVADNNRRAAVSDLLSAYGPRVQFSVFEVTLTSREAHDALLEALTEAIDTDEDQVRVYRLRAPDLAQVVVLGNRRLEEREDFWIV